MRNHLFQNLGYQNILSPLSLALILSPSVSHSHVLMEASMFEGEKKNSSGSDSALQQRTILNQILPNVSGYQDYLGSFFNNTSSWAPQNIY